MSYQWRQRPLDFLIRETAKSHKREEGHGYVLRRRKYKPNEINQGRSSQEVLQYDSQGLMSNDGRGKELRLMVPRSPGTVIVHGGIINVSRCRPAPIGFEFALTP